MSFQNSMKAFTFQHFLWYRAFLSFDNLEMFLTKDISNFLLNDNVRYKYLQKLYLWLPNYTYKYFSETKRGLYLMKWPSEMLFIKNCHFKDLCWNISSRINFCFWRVYHMCNLSNIVHTSFLFTHIIIIFCIMTHTISFSYCDNAKQVNE